MSVVLAEAVLLVLEAEAVPVLPVLLVLPVLELPGSGGAVPFSLSVPAQNVAGFGVDLIVILLAGGVELHLIDAHTIVPVGLYNEVQASSAATPASARAIS